MSSSPKFVFSETLEECFHLNQLCLDVSKQLETLVTFVSDSEVEVSLPTKISFKPITQEENEKVFVFSLRGTTTIIPLKNLAESFSKFSNPLNTKFPTNQYFDLKQQLKLYELLKPSKAVGLVLSVRDALKSTLELLKEDLENVERKIGLNAEILRAVGREKQTFFRFVEQPFSREVSLRFEVELSHERSLLEVKHFQKVIKKYFEKIEIESEIKQAEFKLEGEKERVRRERLGLNPIQTFVFEDYTTGKLVEEDIYFSNHDFKLSGKFKPSSEPVPGTTVLFGQDRSCYGASQFRIGLVKDNYLGLIFGSDGIATRGSYTKFENGACHPDGGRFISEVESMVPLTVGQWGELVLERRNDTLILTLNGETRKVEIKGFSKMKYPPHVTFRVGSRHPIKGDAVDDCYFRGDIKDFKIELFQKK